MQAFFATPALFWSNFVWSFLLCTGLGALVQCWFLIRFCALKSRKRDYAIYLLLSYVLYLEAILTRTPLSSTLDTLFGAGILFVFLRLLKQHYILSAMVATLTMAITSMVESVIFLLESVLVSAAAIESLIPFVSGLLFPAISLVLFRFFVERYSVRSRHRSKYLLAFSLPIFFIAIVLRNVNAIRYTMTKEGLVLQFYGIQTYEMLAFTVLAFLCICTVLFAYEKTIHQVETEQERAVLQTQIEAQKNYVAEASQKYETTKAFRHDFNNHIVALRGLIRCGDLKKAADYMDRFEQTYQEMTVPLHTGNRVVDILLGEKLSYAEQVGIRVKCNITIPAKVKLDDFDLCAIFANTIDNAIKACQGIQNGEKLIDIVAKPNKNFFVIDLMNPYQTENAPKGSGLGLTILHIIAEKYHGAVEISAEDPMFRISIILPFNE